MSVTDVYSAIFLLCKVNRGTESPDSILIHKHENIRKRHV